MRRALQTGAKSCFRRGLRLDDALDRLMSGSYGSAANVAGGLRTQKSNLIPPNLLHRLLARMETKHQGFQSQEPR